MKKLMAIAMFSLGFLQLYAIDAVKQQHKLLRIASSKEEKVAVWNELAWIYKTSVHDSALFYARKVLMYARKNSRVSIMGDSYSTMGAYFFHRGMYDSACVNHQKAYKTRKAASNFTLTANSAFNTGACYLRLEKFSEGVDYLKDALNFYGKASDSRGIVNSHIQLIVAYTENAEFAEARKQISKIDSSLIIREDLTLRAEYLMARARFQERILKYKLESEFALKASFIYKKDSTQKQNLARSFNYAGNGHKGLKNTDSALSYYSRAYILAKQGYNSSLKQQLLGNIGQLWSIIGDVDSTAHYFGLARLIPGARTNGLLQKQLGDHFFETNQFDSAVTAYLNALEFSPNSEPTLMEIFYNLHYAYKKSGKHEKATDALFQHTQLKDTMEMASKKLESLEKKINQVRAKLEVEKERKEKERIAQQLRSQNLMSGIIISVLLIVLLLGVIAYQRETNRKNIVKKNKEVLEQKVDSLLKSQELKSIANVLEIQEKERMRIAQDLHDRLGGMLATVKLLFDDVQMNLGRLQTQSQTSYRKALSILDTASNEVRKVAHDLVSGSLKNFGLKVALKELADTIRQPNSIEFEFICHGLDERLPKDHEAHLYRIVQEMVSNTLKHSRANRIALQLLKDKNRLNLIYEDNGLGFSPGNNTPGMGLKSIESRVKKLDGTLHIDSRKGLGTTFNITIELKTKNHDTAYHSG